MSATCSDWRWASIFIWTVKQPSWSSPPVFKKRNPLFLNGCVCVCVWCEKAPASLETGLSVWMTYDRHSPPLWALMELRCNSGSFWFVSSDKTVLMLLYQFIQHIHLVKACLWLSIHPSISNRLEENRCTSSTHYYRWVNSSNLFGN